MRFVSAFQHSESLELAIIELEQMGIPKDRIFTAPLDKNNENLPTLKSTHDGADSMVDLIFIFASIGMLLGCIYGFVLRLGPILWGLFGAIIGGGVGLAIEYFSHRPIQFKRKKSGMEVVLLVDCDRPKQKKWNIFFGAILQLEWQKHKSSFAAETKRVQKSLLVSIDKTGGN